MLRITQDTGRRSSWLRLFQRGTSGGPLYGAAGLTAAATGQPQGPPGISSGRAAAAAAVAAAEGAGGAAAGGGRRSSAKTSSCLVEVVLQWTPQEVRRSALGRY